MRENGLPELMSNKVKAHKSGQTVLCTRDAGKLIKPVAEVDFIISTETSMKVNGLMTKQMDKVFILMKMEPNMMAAGRMTCNMVQE